MSKLDVVVTDLFQCRMNPIPVDYWDTKILRKSGDSLITTPYFQFIAAKNAQVLMKKLVLTKDHEMRYHFETHKNIPDPAELKQVKSKYSKEKKEADQLKAKWREDNQDLFVEVMKLPSVSGYFRNFKTRNLNDVIMTLDQAVNGLMAANMVVERFNGETDQWKTAVSKEISPDHADEWKQVQKNIDAKVGLPTTAEMNTMCTQIDGVNTRMAKFTQEQLDHMDPESAALYTETLVHYLHDNDLLGH